jgi:hypothetical protein
MIIISIQVTGVTIAGEKNPPEVSYDIDRMQGVKRMDIYQVHFALILITGKVGV